MSPQGTQVSKENGQLAKREGGTLGEGICVVGNKTWGAGHPHCPDLPRVGKLKTKGQEIL